MKLSVVAGSATVRPCGPTVSWLCEIGTTPPRLVNPTVGLIPTTPFTFAGHTMLPSVSLPSETAVKFADVAAADPELDPQALRSREYGLCTSPPRPDQPLVEKNERKFAHSERLVLPRITAPALRSAIAMVESCSAGLPYRANDPAVVCILSPVSMLSFSSIGMPSSGLLNPCLRKLSALRAMASASGLLSMTEFTPGPL